MATCNCDGSVSDVSQSLPDAAYHLAGTTSPTQDATTACATALAQLQADQIDCQSALDYMGFNLLDQLFQQNLTDAQSVAYTEPNQNPIQAAADKAIGASAPGTPTVTNKPPAPPNNSIYLIGAAILLLVGFVLLVRA